MITIVDYGMGNLFSIHNAMARASASVQVIDSPDSLKDADGIIVPGVGAFGRCMERLQPFKAALEEKLHEGTPILGICIGQQVLFEKSEESPGVFGLGWLEGTVERLPPGVTIPQMGWNSLSIKRQVPLLDGIADGDMFYFVHSYHCLCKDPSAVVATTQYGTAVVAAISRDNLSATQFHPEKSGAKGLRILENFVRSVKC